MYNKSNNPSYVASEHAGVFGLSSRMPFSNILVRGLACTPLYGVLPPLNISHIVTPYDHYQYIYNIIQLLSLNGNLVNRNFREWVGCEALALIQDNGSL